MDIFQDKLWSNPPKVEQFMVCAKTIEGRDDNKATG